MRLVAVTGASGHLGANICRSLLERNYKVRALHRIPSTALTDLAVEEMLGEITDKSFMRQALTGVDAVIHCAAKISIDGDKGGEVRRTNVQGTECVITLCRQLHIKRLVHISSVHAFDLKKSDFLSNASDLARDYGFAYDKSKRDGLLSVQQAAAAGLNALILCPVGLLGPEDHRLSLMGGFFINLYRKKLPALVKGAFHWADVRDTAAAAIRALEQGAPGGIYLLNGHYASIQELAQIAQKVCQKSIARPALPYQMALLGLPFLRGIAALTGAPPLYTYESLYVLRHHPKAIDDRPAKRDLNYQLRPLERTVADVYNWFHQQNHL